MAKATTSGSNVYGADWSGPSTNEFTVSGMSAAIVAFNAAIGPPLPGPSSSSGTTLSPGIIAGITLGSVTLTLCVIVVSYLGVRRRRQQERVKVATDPLDIDEPSNAPPAASEKVCL
jgi:hypothetical protein